MVATALWSDLRLYPHGVEEFQPPRGLEIEQEPVNRRMLDRNVNRLSREILLQIHGRRASINSSKNVTGITILRYLKVKYGVSSVNYIRMFVHVTHAPALVVERLHPIAFIYLVSVAVPTQGFVTGTCCFCMRPVMICNFDPCKLCKTRGFLCVCCHLCNNL